MNKYQLKDKNGKTWERISKPTAKKNYMEGKEIVFCPCNLRPFTPWGYEMKFSREIDAENYPETTPQEAWEDHLMYYTYYNCTDAQTGRTTAFYLCIE